MATTKRHRVVVDDSALAMSIGTRIRELRRRAGLSQQQLAEGRYTKAYISALETGAAKPSMAALNFISGRLGTTAAEILANPGPAWTRLEADLLLASDDVAAAADAYESLLLAGTDPTLRAELLRSLAEAHCRLDRPVEAIREATESVELYTGLGRRADRAQAAIWLASGHLQHDNAEEGRAILASLLEEVRAGLQVAPGFEFRLLVGLGMCETSRGAFQSGIAYLEEARALSGDLDDERRGAVLQSLANGYRGAGDHEAAIRCGTQALALFRSVDDELQAAILENNLALAYLAIGSGERAIGLIADARAIAGRYRDDRLLAHLADTEAQVTLGLGNPEAAIGLAKAAAVTAEQAGNDKARIDSGVTLGRALSAVGRIDEAIDAFAAAAALAREHAAGPRQREVLRAWADALAAAGRHEEAFAIAREALATEIAAPDTIPAAVGVPRPV